MSNVMIDAGAAVVDNEPLNPDDVAAFLDGKLEGNELARVEAHLADNPGARQELIKASRIIATAPNNKTKRSFRFAPLLGLAAAASIALVLIRSTDSARESTAISTERRGIGDEPDRVEIVFPLDAQRLGADERNLIWNAVAGSRYHVVISDVNGKTVHEADMSDTVLTLPSSIHPANYFWRVDALAADGTSITSSAHEFVLTEK